MKTLIWTRRHKEPTNIKERRQSALQNFRKGLKLYEQGWIVEHNCGGDRKSKPDGNNCIAAAAGSDKFFSAVQKFERALSLHSNDPEIIRHYKLAVRKVRGNEKFESALKCQRQARMAECIQKDYKFAALRYQDAIDDFTAARKHFEKGRWVDLRFDNFLKIVVESLQSAISSKIRLSMMDKMLTM